MNINELSTQSLHDLHSLIREAVKTDDAVTNGVKRYGVRDYPDWQRQAEAFEEELSKRNIPFEKIQWT